MGVERNDLVIPSYKEIFKNLPVIFLLYIYFFQPPVINKNIYLALEVVALTAYLFFVEAKPIVNFIARFRYEFLLLTLIIIYSVLRDLAAGEEVYAFRFAAWSFQAFILGYAIIDFLETSNRKKEGKYSLLTLLYWTAFVAAILTFLLITVRPIDNYYQAIQLDDYESYDAMETRYRAYGMAENLTFTYSYFLGFFAGYTLLAIRKNVLLVLPFLLFLLGVFFNARIGFVGIILFLVVLIFRRQWKNLFITGSLSVLIVGGIIVTNADLMDLISSNKDWVFQFFYDISDSLFGTHLSTGPAGSTIKTLTGDFLVFPDTFLSWIFGTGESLFVKAGGGNSDIGYIIQLNYGGLILLTLILTFVAYSCYRLYKVLGWRHWFVVVFTFSVLILNYKGFIFAATPGGRLLFFLYVYFVYKSYKTKSSEEYSDLPVIK